MMILFRTTLLLIFCIQCNFALAADWGKFETIYGNSTSFHLMRITPDDLSPVLDLKPGQNPLPFVSDIRGIPYTDGYQTDGATFRFIAPREICYFIQNWDVSACFYQKISQTDVKVKFVKNEYLKDSTYGTFLEVADADVFCEVDGILGYEQGKADTILGESSCTFVLHSEEDIRKVFHSMNPNIVTNSTKLVFTVNTFNFGENGDRGTRVGVGFFGINENFDFYPDENRGKPFRINYLSLGSNWSERYDKPLFPRM